ncbi:MULTISPECIES: hypothetical protein [unclassified Streptomyces]|uniref:hypothetical protein n=1 Tax=unclassified Streptomyces TaxID=2593676 RepID=UPI002DDBE8AC|nr:hypothetical protein [Streptomyces sp. NBC_01750]WSA98809.1 hypothetical protein OIE54_05800 [Streptomyces sp. NBC_01794]WSD36621.1 hypothetical protein OG966_34765 [Streptomyces sp. NBC_01750]
MSATAPVVRVVGVCDGARSPNSRGHPQLCDPYRTAYLDEPDAPAMAAMFSPEDLLDGHGDDSP